MLDNHKLAGQSGMKDKAGKRKRQSAEISFGDLLVKVEGWIKYLISKWVTILVFCILGAVIGDVTAVFKKPVFTAASTFVLEDADKIGGLGQYAGIASMVGLDLSLSDGGGIFQGDNIIELYKSNTMIEKTLLTEVSVGNSKVLLINRYIEFNKLRDKWAEYPALRDLRFSAIVDTTNSNQMRLRDSVLATVVADVNQNYLTIAKPDKRLNIIKAVVKAPDEFFAKNFDEQIVKNVNDFYIQTKTTKSLMNVRLLQQKTDSVRAAMDGAIYSAAAVADATPNLNPSRQSMRVAPMQRSQFSAETNRAILGELAKNLEMSKISLQKETPLIQVIDKPKYPLENSSVSPRTAAVASFFFFGIAAILFFWLKKVYMELKMEVT
jgi:hypothetical protein